MPGCRLEEAADGLTRPGAPAVTIAEELDRVMPVLEALRDCPVPVSLDTPRKRANAIPTPVI